MPATLSATEALRLLLEEPEATRAVDVRSEGEFGIAAIPGFMNFPILTNPERHEVGTSYKQKGQDTAIELGHALTAPHREARIEAWRLALGGAEYPLLTCFRGGLRSKIACEWLRAGGTRVLQVDGGYKAMRQELLGEIARAPAMLVISGPTGSGKSELLRECGAPVLDLELHANHKGSAFGASLTRPQPAQATFENAVGLSLRKLARVGRSELLVEDESALVGQVAVPPTLRERIFQGAVVRIHMGVEERAARIYREYVTEPLQEGVAAERILAHYQKSLRNIERRLGGKAATEIDGKMSLAFRDGGEGMHREWIQPLLELYYDQAYEYSFRRLEREIAFEGSWEECKQWIRSKFA